MRKAGLADRAIAFMQFAGKTGLFDECRDNRMIVLAQIWKLNIGKVFLCLFLFLSLSCIFFCKLFISYIEDGDSIELATDTDKREYNTESYGVFEDTFDKSEEKEEMLSKMVESELMQI